MDTARKAWECMSFDEVRRLLAVDPVHGLNHDDVARRRTVYGSNALAAEAQRGIMSVVAAQFKSPLVFVLLGAGVVTAGIQEYADSIVILIALTINVVVGTLQERKADNAFNALNRSQARRAIVMRDGKRLNIPTEDLVPGDVVLLEGGYFVPADLRLYEEKDLTVSEAALTGEWIPVAKDAAPLHAPVTLTERTNMVWMGTLIESGVGRGVVVATGNATEIGTIARSLGTLDNNDTPLQTNLHRIAQTLSYAVGAALVCIMVLGVLREQALFDMLLIAIAVAVATIPSGLPAAVTVVLAAGMESILKRGGLVRNLLAAETLGATTVILTDKTGTLTEGRMRLAGLYSIAGIRDQVTGPIGDNRFLLELAVQYSDAFIEEGTDAPSTLTVHGRPIEKAIVLSGLEAGIVQSELLQNSPRIDALQFTSERRFGASLHGNPKKKLPRLIIAGEPEKLIAAASFVRVDGKRVRATRALKQQLLDALHREAHDGKRTIAVSYRDFEGEDIPESSADTAKTLVTGTVLSGILAFEDAVRTDVSHAIEAVRQAGASVMMITGDNPETAAYVARAVGIIEPGNELVILGSDMDAWSDQELGIRLSETRVIARALPEHKLRIARILRNNGDVVAMTGDGINDAPALRAASIGISIGSGTEVAKEASDLVLMQSSFSVIVSAVEEGRRIIENLKKIVAYLLSTSFSEVFLLVGALAAGLPLPILPTQILWSNIVGGDLMSFAFAFEPADASVMRRNPRSSRIKNILTRDLRTMILALSAISGVLTIGVYYWLSMLGTPIEEVRTIMFVAISLDSLFFAFSLKSFDRPIWRISFFSNRYLFWSVAMSSGFLVLAFTWQPLAHILSIAPLSTFELSIIAGIGITNLCSIEAVKLILNRRRALREKGWCMVQQSGPR